MRRLLVLFLVLTLLSGYLVRNDKPDDNYNDENTTSESTTEIQGGTESDNNQNQQGTSGVVTEDPMAKAIADYSPDLSEMTMSEGISDTIDMSDEESKKSHFLTTNGNVYSENIVTRNGTVKETYAALKFEGKGAEAEFILDLSSPEASCCTNPMMLEIMEVHNNNYQAFGYTIFINGKKVYFRTYEELATGTIHYFVPFSRLWIRDSSEVKVKIVSEDDSPFSIGMVWGYNDFYGLMQEEDVLTKMGLNLFCSGDTDKGSAFVKDYSSLKSFEPSPLYEVDYINNLNSVSASRLENFSSSSAKDGSGVQLMLKKHWLFVDGADGLGGKWSDLKYQQVQYDSVNKIYTNTTPNGWSNTHWLRMSDNHINNVSCNKLDSILRYYADSFALSAVSGNIPKEVQMIMGHGTGYYYESDFYGGDFNQDIINEAERRGIRLDPTDGLTYEEKRYMYLIIAEMNQKLADTYREALGRNPVTVNENEVTLPTYQITENLYSHGTQSAAQWPSYDDRITGWMSGIGTGYWPSSENMWFDDQRLYEYQMGYGRIGCVNLEMHTHGSREAIQSYLKQGYSNGMEYVTMFNDRDEFNTFRNVKAIDNLQNKRVKENHYERSCLDVDYMRDFNTNMISDISLTEGVVSYENCKVGDTGNLFCDDINKTAIVTYKVSDKVDLKNGLKIYIEGLINSDSEIEIYGGEDLNKLKKIGKFEDSDRINIFNKHSAYNLDITRKTKGVSEYYIQLRMSVDSSSDSEVSIRAIKVTTPWDKKSGSLNCQKTTYAERRMQSLWVAEREALESLMKDYKMSAGTDSVYKAACKLYDYGRYKSAYKLLTGEISQVLPAKYAVETSGRLGKYPVEVSMNTGSSVVVELQKVSSSEISFRLISEEKQKVTFSVSSLKNDAYYLLKNDSGTDKYSIVIASADTDGAVKALDGKITFVTDSVPRSVFDKKITDTTVVGRVYYGSDGNSVLLQVQDPDIGEYGEGISFPTAENCTFVRYQEGLNNEMSQYPCAGDCVTVKLDENGYATEVISVYGNVSGKIVSFEKPAVTGEECNGIITLDNGVSYEIEYGGNTTVFDMTYLKGVARSIPIANIAQEIKVGQTVNITYCPPTHPNSYRRILTITEQ